MTVAEREVMQAALPIAHRYFDTNSTRLWTGQEDSPHAYLIIGYKRQSPLPSPESFR